MEIETTYRDRCSCDTSFPCNIFENVHSCQLRDVLDQIQFNLSWIHKLTAARQTTISDLIQISPEDFSKYSAVAIEDNINEKYANKVR